MSVLHQISGCQNPNRKGDVVFIHGLGGDAFGTWRNGSDESTSWPHWIGKEFSEIGVWSLGYAASPTKWLRWIPRLSRNAGHAMALPDRSKQVLDLFRQNGLGQRPLVLICHSLGGLLAKHILRGSSDASSTSIKCTVFQQVRSVLFLATPHAGAELASMVDGFRNILGSTVNIEDLRAHDAHLRELYDWYRNHGHVAGCHTYTYYETRSIAGFRIVNPTSSHPGIGADPVALDDDHLSIAKPRHANAQVCGAARRIILNHVLVSLPPLPTASHSQTTHSVISAQEIAVRVVVDPPHRTQPHTPCQLPPRATAEEFFGRREQLASLISRLQQGKNTSVVGPACFGKTALAAEALIELVGSDGAKLASSRFRDGIVLLDLYRLKADREAVWTALANALIGTELSDRPPEVRARYACTNRRILVIFEGAEEADSVQGRPSLGDLLQILDPTNRRLVLTRDRGQAIPSETVFVDTQLLPHDAAALLDQITGGRLYEPERSTVIELLEGHPLALTWAAELLAREEESPDAVVKLWQATRLPKLTDPTDARLTLLWLFKRSVRGTSELERTLLSGAGLLAHAPLPFEAAMAAVGQSVASDKVREALRRLVQRGLLRRSTSESNDSLEAWQFTHVLGYQFSRQEMRNEVQLRLRLAEWCKRTTAELIEAGPERVLFATALNRTLQHAEALLKTDCDQRLEELATFLLYTATDRLNALGSLSLARNTLEAFGGWMSSWSEEFACRSKAERERSVYFNRLGDLAKAQGKLSEAERHFVQDLAIAQRLAEADPANSDWQRDLSISLTKLGDLAKAQGKLPEAERYFTQALAIAQRFTGLDSANADWQRDLSISFNKLGDLAEIQGNLPEAGRYFAQALVIRKGLAETDPGNADRQRDLSISINKLGDLAKIQGNLSEAEDYFAQTLVIRKRLAESDPANTDRQRDLSISFNKLGDLARAQGNLSEAERYFAQDLAIIRRLVEADPTNANWQRDLSVSFSKLGDLARGQGKLPEAELYFSQDLAIIRRLTEADPANAEWQRDLFVSHMKVALLKEAKGEIRESIRSAQNALQIIEKLAVSDPTNSRWQQDLKLCRHKFAHIQAAAGGGDK